MAPERPLVELTETGGHFRPGRRQRFIDALQRAGCIPCAWTTSVPALRRFAYLKHLQVLKIDACSLHQPAARA